MHLLYLVLRKQLEKHITISLEAELYIHSRTTTLPILLESCRHYVPHTINEDAPLKYMALGLANKYYEGEGELGVDGLCEDPQVINWYVINYKSQLKG